MTEDSESDGDSEYLLCEKRAKYIKWTPEENQSYINFLQATLLQKQSNP